MKKLSLFVSVLLMFCSGFGQVTKNYAPNIKLLHEPLIEEMKMALLKGNADRFEQYFVDKSVFKKAKASLAIPSSRVAVVKPMPGELVYSRKYFNDSEVVTFAYGNVTAEIFCRIHFATNEGSTGRMIRSFQLEQGKDVTGEEKFQEYIKNMWGDDTPPPMREIDERH